jgi:hypothetical protein
MQGVDPSYLGRDYSRSTLTVMNVSAQEISIDNPDDFDDDFPHHPAYVDWLRSAEATSGGKPAMFRELFLSHELSRYLPNRAASKWPRIRVASAGSIPSFASGEEQAVSCVVPCDYACRIENGAKVPPPATRASSEPFGRTPDRPPETPETLKLEFRVPTKEALDRRRVGSDFALVFEKVGFSRTDPTSRLPGQVGPGSSGHVNAGLRYAVYDYAAQKVVACGVAHGEGSFNFRLDLRDWFLAIDDMLDDVKTPF